MATQLRPKLNSFFIIIFVFLLQSNGITQGAYFTRKPPAVQYVLEGQNASFNWDYSTSIDLLFGKWKKATSSIACLIKQASSSGVSLNSAAECQNFVLEGNATLILTNVSKAMDGDYECDLTFVDFNELKSSTSLRVVSKVPAFRSSQSSVTGIEGGNSVVITREIAGDYLPVISWYKNNALVNTTLYPTSFREINSNVVSDKMVQANLTIMSVKRNLNNDDFVVKATYGAHSPTSNTSIKIIVWYGPENLKFSSTRSGMGVLDGQSVTVTCSADSNPPSKFTFFHNNSVVIKNSTSGVLMIPSFSRNDSGNYSCMAANEVSNATVDGVWFVYAQPVFTTSTTQISTSRATNGTTEQSNTTASTNSTSEPDGRTGTTDELLPWWAWLAIGLGIFFVITIPILMVCIIKGRCMSKKGSAGASKNDSMNIDIDNYIMTKNYPSGYENQVELPVYEQKDANRERSIDNPYPEEAKTNLDMKFESEHDLIEHWKQRPEDHDDIDFKNYDPFEEDDTDGIEYGNPFAEVSDDPMAFDNEVYQEDDIVQVKSESEKGSDKEPELFTESDNDIVMYDI